jgi:hypothetical protein
LYINQLKPLLGALRQIPVWVQTALQMGSQMSCPLKVSSVVGFGGKQPVRMLMGQELSEKAPPLQDRRT